MKTRIIAACLFGSLGLLSTSAFATEEKIVLKCTLSEMWSGIVVASSSQEFNPNYFKYANSWDLARIEVIGTGPSGRFQVVVRGLESQKDLSRLSTFALIQDYRSDQYSESRSTTANVDLSMAGFELELVGPQETPKKVGMKNPLFLSCKTEPRN